MITEILIGLGIYALIAYLIMLPIVRWVYGEHPSKDDAIKAGIMWILSPLTAWAVIIVGVCLWIGGKLLGIKIDWS